ncbi:MAG: hypothetical protein JHC95_16995 [Solirubrobacteraceae bacterium]|nr:hypothetical protein [Solirubrobacteraceae bacterium]
MRAPLLVLLVLALLVAAPVASAAPKPGVFSGSLGVTVPKGAQADVRAVNRADATVTESGQVSRRGAFTLKLPPGAYTVLGTIVPREGRPTLVRSAVTLKAGQKRAKANLKKKRKPRARAAYAQELGQVTPGRIALGIPTFTGPPSGDLHYLAKGLSALTVTDLVGGYVNTPCKLTVVEIERRAEVLKELEFQQSPYVDPSTRLTRNLILHDIEVRGTLTPVGSDGDFTVTMRLVETATGKEVGKVEKSVTSNDQVFEQLEDASQALADELCKFSDVYKVTLNASGRGNFATHSGSGTVTSTLNARRAKKDEMVWTDSGPFQWGSLSVATKIAECPLLAPIAPAVTWSATLRLSGEQLQVSWDLAGNDMATATVDCVPSGKDDPDPPPIPGMPVVSLLNTAPRQFTVPVAGGIQPIAGSVAEGADGFFDDGTIEIKPGGVRRTG